MLLPIAVLAFLAWLYASGSLTLAEGIQGFILAVLAWYAAETRKIRWISQRQLEALHKPCLLLATEARDPDDALLGVDDTVSVLIVSSHNGNVTVENVGNGTALNIGFEFKAIGQTEAEKKPPSSRGYLPSLTAQTSFTVPFPREMLRNHECELACSYESLGGEMYRSRIKVINLVVTHVGYECVSHGRLRRVFRGAIEGAKEGAKGKPWIDPAFNPRKKSPEPTKPVSKEYQEQYDKEQAFFKRHGWAWFVEREGSDSVTNRVLAVAVLIVMIVVAIGIMRAAVLWVLNRVVR
jgi:hypothetical protein